MHIGQVSDSGAVDSRLLVYYSQIQLSILIHTHLWSHWSLILKQAVVPGGDAGLCATSF